MSDPTISVNIVCMDHYLHSPIKDLDPFMSEFRGTNVERLPILRIFGSTYEGIKACVHIHGVFPYFYVPCEKDCNNPSAIAYQLASSIDKAINITFNQATSTQQHVYSVTQEQGIPFYGFHNEEHHFFKLCFYNPTMIKRASALLQSGNIMGSVFQPFECHIPYKQQFMIDYNLFGMNFVQFANPKYRDDVTIKKQSVCPLEFDILAKDILNQFDITPGNVACNPGIQYIRDEIAKRDGLSKTELSASDLTQNRIDIEPTITDLNYREKLRAKIKNTSTQNSNDSTLNTSMSLTTSLLDISLLDNTQLEEHAQLFLQLWNDNQTVNADDRNEENDIDDDCVLSQHKSVDKNKEPEEDNCDNDDLNFTLLDFMSSLDIDVNNEQFEPKTP